MLVLTVSNCTGSNFLHQQVQILCTLTHMLVITRCNYFSIETKGNQIVSPSYQHQLVPSSTTKA